MDFLFTPEQEMFRDSARNLMARMATADYVRRLDSEKKFPDELYHAWVEAGFLGAPFPEHYGGLGCSLIDVAILAEELARTSSDFVMPYAAGLFCGLNLLRNGSEGLKKKWLPKLITGNVKFSIGLSEPDAGSDLGAIRTTARREGGHYLINGLKTWQTAAGAKDNVINLYVKTGNQEDYRQNLSLLLVPNDAAGVTLTKLDLLGRYCSGTYQVAFDDVRVPVENLVGRENEGWKCLLSGLVTERAVVAACDCGSASAVVEMTIAYARERRQFERSIGSNQALAHMIADIQTEVEAARALTWRAIWLTSQHRESRTVLRDVAMAKLYAAETYVRASNVGMQVFGGNGYSVEYDIQRHYRDCRIATVVAGSSQILRNLIAGLSGLSQ